MKWNQKLWTDGGRCTMAAAVECRRLLLQKLWWWWRWWSIYADGKTDRPPNDETSGRSAQSNLKSDGACNIIICRGNPGPPRSNRMHNIKGRWACIYIGAANRPFRHTKKETHPPKKRCHGHQNGRCVEGSPAAIAPTCNWTSRAQQLINQLPMIHSLAKW